MVDVLIDRDLCEDSGYCLQVCPDDVFQMRAAQIVVVKPENCSECWLCVQNCPSGAVSIE
jgi:NAD-dependent dihydropyrimidine dehydrogenase PreA subunit